MVRVREEGTDGVMRECKGSEEAHDPFPLVCSPTPSPDPKSSQCDPAFGSTRGRDTLTMMGNLTQSIVSRGSTMVWCEERVGFQFRGVSDGKGEKPCMADAWLSLKARIRSPGQLELQLQHLTHSSPL